MDDPAVEGLEELEIIREFVNTLRGGVECAVAYGSGAIRQEGYEKGKRSVVDLILGVTNAWAWHDANLKVNGSHYSLPARLMGGMGISKIQECSGGRIYYNVGVEHCGVKLKYGVVAMRRLVEDLLVWDNFYLAGRFHKPVAYLKGSEIVEAANRYNRLSAVRATLLMLGEVFSEDDLLSGVVGLSYIGDFRMAFGENPMKVKNIVSAQRHALRKILEPSLRRYARAEGGDGRVFRKFRDRLLSGRSIGRVARLPQTQLSACVTQAVKSISRQPALAQAVKGLVSAGLLTSAGYALRKLGLFLGAKMS